MRAFSYCEINIGWHCEVNRIFDDSYEEIQSFRDKCGILLIILNYCC